MCFQSLTLVCVTTLDRLVSTTSTSLSLSFTLFLSLSLTHWFLSSYINSTDSHLMWFIGLEFLKLQSGGVNLELTYEIQIFVNSGL